MTDSAFTYILAPPGGSRRSVNLWDELVAGTNHRIGWLGRPRGPAAHLAERAPDLMRGAGPALVPLLSSDDAHIAADGDAVKLAARDAGAKQFTVRLRGLAATGPDLFVALQARAEPMAKSAPERARLMHASLVAAGGGESPRFMSWLNPRDFGSTFYFNDVKAKTVDLELTFESAEPVWISALTVHAVPDTMLREFEHGLVLANPSRHAHTFDLAALFPGQSFHRFQATPAQDTKVNNGAPVTAKLELGPKDALFLLKD